MADRWPANSVAIHWAAAVLLGGMALGGFVMTELPAASELRRWIARLHTVGGLLLVALTVARLVVRRRGPKPEPLPVPALHRRGIGVVHALLYAVTFAIGASGFVTARLSDQTWHEYLMGRLAEVPSLAHLATREAHERLVFAMMVLVALHVGGVMVQQLRAGGTLRRMIPFLR